MSDELIPEPGMHVTSAEVFDQLRQINPTVMDLAVARAQRQKLLTIVTDLRARLDDYEAPIDDGVPEEPDEDPSEDDEVESGWSDPAPATVRVWNDPTHERVPQDKT